MLLTIFTPTYNRAYCLGVMYRSLCLQTSKDFEWLIVDDGSSDNTKDMVESWISENIINIRYILQYNGGKHRAINRGVANAQGILFYIVDSDDYLPCHAVSNIRKHFEHIKNKSEFAGICGRRSYAGGSFIGDQSDFGVLECSNFDFRYKYKHYGDMAEIFYTSVMKEFPFPEIDGEKFCPEALVWNRISTKYIIRYFCESIYVGEYLPDGLTAKITRIRMESPVASTMCYSEMTRCAAVPFVQKAKAAINYWRFRLCRKDTRYPAISFVWLWAIIPGLFMHVNDLRLNK